MGNLFFDLLNLIGYLIRRYVFGRKIKLEPIGTYDLTNSIIGIIIIIIIIIIASWIKGWI